MGNLSTKNYPSMTIFCTLFKGAKFIKGYMEDMVRQSIFKEVDFYILDCASPENEVSTIEPYLSYPNIRYERLNEDPGLYAGWNICINNSNTDLVGNWNVDDRKTDWSLEVLRNCFALDKKVDVAYGLTAISEKANETWGEMTPFWYYQADDLTDWKDLIKNNHPHCMPVWKKDLHDRYGLFNEGYKTAADSDMWIRAAKGGAKFKFVRQPVGVYFRNPEGMSSKPENMKIMLDEVNKMRKEHDPSYVPRPIPKILA